MLHASTVTTRFGAEPPFLNGRQAAGVINDWEANNVLWTEGASALARSNTPLRQRRVTASTTDGAYGLIWVPSAFLIGNLKPVPAGNGLKGYLAASFSSMSTPIPGASFKYIYPFFICGQPGKTS